MMAKNYVGSKFGRLSVMERFPSYLGKKKTYYRCICECGNEVYVASCNLGKHCNSCGCLAKDLAREKFSTHGKTQTRLYTVWLDMRRRCEKEYDQVYKYYGARGITVCEEWQDFQNFYNWAYENGYDENAEYGRCTLDRIDNNGNYCPENCRWVDGKTQANNRHTNVSFEFNGETHTLAEWARISQLSYRTLYSRYITYKWSAVKTMTTPLRIREKLN